MYMFFNVMFLPCVLHHQQRLPDGHPELRVCGVLGDPGPRGVHQRPGDR